MRNKQKTSKKSRAVAQPLPPFSIKQSAQFAELLTQFKGSIALSTFQADKLCIFSAKDENFCIQLLRTIPQCMGFDYKEEYLFVASQTALHQFKNIAGAAANYPNAANTYDAVYVERSTQHTGRIDAHDVVMADVDEVYMVYTHGNSIYRYFENEMQLYWQPPFIENNSLEDRCHMNGLCLVNGQPKYVSMLGTANKKESWRNSLPNGGAIMDMQSNEFIIKDLHMPHSPRMYQDKLLVLESAKERLIEVDVETGKTREIVSVPGFLRGMHIVGDYAIIGSSKLRKNSSIFNGLPIASKPIKAGVYIVYLPTGAIVGHSLFENTVDEIFEVKLLPHTRPNVLPASSIQHKLLTVFEEKPYWVELPQHAE